MSRLFSVVVLCPNGRRESIKVSSNSCILQVLEEACQKQDLNPAEFDLYHHKKPLDLSLPLRFANLPNNASLEIRPSKNERKECLVTIALQLESGERLMGNYSPSSTLSDVVKQSLRLDSSNNQQKREPTCIYMRQKISGDAINSTTLRSLGLTQGTAIIRLLYREPEKLESQAHVFKSLSSKPIQSVSPVQPVNDASVDKLVVKDIHEKIGVTSSEKKERCFESMETDNSENGTKETTQPLFSNSNIIKQEEENKTASLFSNDQKVDKESNLNNNVMIEEKLVPEEKIKVEEMECDRDIKVEPEDIGEINYIGDRHAVLYSLEDITDTKKADLPEEFFELTVNEVRYLMEEYKRERILLENQPLLIKEQREKQLCQKLAGYNKTVIRVYFPEKMVIQADFNVTETVQTVIDFLRNYLENKELNFYLYTTPPKVKLVNTKTLLENSLVPAAVVHFGCDLQLQTFLQNELKQKKSDPRAAALAASESRKENVENLPTDSVSENTDIKLKSSSESTSTSTEMLSPTVRPKPGKIPKWMQLSRK